VAGWAGSSGGAGATSGVAGAAGLDGGLGPGAGGALEAGTETAGASDAHREVGTVPYRAQAVVAGGGHTCALLDDGNVKCWGLNLQGQLGYGDTYRRGSDPADMGDNLPLVDLGQGRLAKAIAAGGNTTCVILDDDSVKCWGGAELLGLPGDGTQNRGDQPGEMGDALPALALGQGRRAVQIAVGAAVACALLDDGSVSCWGKGAPSRTPSPVSASSFNPTSAPVRTLAGSGVGMLVLFTDGTVTRLFESSTVPFLAPPEHATVVHGLGLEGECALVNGGVVSCNNLVYPGDTYMQSIDGADSFYAYEVNGGSISWGRNLGPDAFTGPVPLPSLSDFGTSGIGMCAIYPDGGVGCQKFFTIYGACTPDWCVPSTAPNDGTIFMQLGQKAVGLTFGGGQHICALLANGEVRCWSGYMSTTNPIDAIGSSFDLVQTNGTWAYGPFHSIDLGHH
jgi:hypothetical protein